MTYTESVYEGITLRKGNLYIATHSLNYCLSIQMGLHLLNLSIKPFKIQIMKKVKTYQFKNKGRNKVSISWQELLPNPKEVKIWLAKQHVASGLRILIEFAFSLLYKDIFCQWAISIPLCHVIWKVEKRKEYLREDSRHKERVGREEKRLLNPPPPLSYKYTYHNSDGVDLHQRGVSVLPHLSKCYSCMQIIYCLSFSHTMMVAC